MMRKHKMSGQPEEQDHCDAEPCIARRPPVESEGPQKCVEGFGSRKIARRDCPSGENENPAKQKSDRAAIKGRKRKVNHMIDAEANKLETNDYPDTFPCIA